MDKNDPEARYFNLELKLIPWRFIVTVLGILLVVGGIAFERYQVFSQRRWQTQQSIRMAEVVRMTEIADSFDQMYSKTLKVLKKETNRHRVLYIYLTNLIEKIDESSIDNTEKIEIKRQLNDFSNTVQKGDITFTEYAAAGSLQGEWEAQRASLAPDMEYYFGAKSTTLWSKVVETAWNALNAKFGIFSDEDESQTTEAFHNSGRKFQTFLREQIRARRKKES